MTAEEVHALYQRFGFPVYRRCLRILRDPDLAQDVLQDVFVRVLRYGDRFRGGSALAWLLRIADRASLDHLVRDRAAAAAGRERSAAPELSSRLLQVAEASRLLSELLAALPPRLQEVAVLSYLDGMTQPEMAAELRCSTMTVKRRIRALHRRARELGGTLPEKEVDHDDELA